MRGTDRCTCPHCGVEYVLRFVDVTWGQIGLAEPLKPGVGALEARRTLDMIETNLKHASVEIQVPISGDGYVPFKERLQRAMWGLALGAFACFIVLVILTILTAE
jgi:hypothetical protein